MKLGDRVAIVTGGGRGIGKAITDEQPALRLFSYRKVGGLPNARLVHRNAFFFGNHHAIGPQEREALVNYVLDFLGSKEPLAASRSSSNAETDRGT